MGGAPLGVLSRYVVNCSFGHCLLFVCVVADAFLLTLLDAKRLT